MRLFGSFRNRTMHSAFNAEAAEKKILDGYSSAVSAQSLRPLRSKSPHAQLLIEEPITELRP
jgi:hypothetical protein